MFGYVTDLRTISSGRSIYNGVFQFKQPKNVELQ